MIGWKDTGVAVVQALRSGRDRDYDTTVLRWAIDNWSLMQRHSPRGRLMMAYRQELIGNGGWPSAFDRRR